jgi:serine/threonine protein kinase
MGFLKWLNSAGAKLSNLGFEYVDEAASELRLIAKNYEDPLQEVFFQLGNIQIRRITNSQDFFANAYLWIARNELVIDFVTLNSRSGKQRQIIKKWSDTIGCLPNEPIMYLKDQSTIEFIPQDRKSYLLLSVFWQVFHDGLNGESRIFHNPVESGLGHRLREAANYVIEHRSKVGPNAIFELDDVPSRIDDEEFFGHGSPRLPEVRDKIQRWRLLEQIGAGGFGQVFKSEHSDTGEQAAIKLMSPTNHDRKKISPTSIEFRVNRERFLDEATLSLKVSSPFVISAIDSGKDPWPWIRYPLVEGQSVAKAMQLSSDTRNTWWNLAHDLISGLSTIHQEGLLHKDVKLDNMLHASDRFVLLDFGIGEVVEYSEFSELAGIGGTYGFMAPELLLTKDPAIKPGFEIDVFSAGMTLLTIFDDEPRLDMMRAQLSTRQGAGTSQLLRFLDEPISLENAPEETWPLLSAMLDFDPTQRPTAKRLLKYVANFVDLEEKIQLIQDHRQPMFGSADDSELGTNENVSGLINGPLKSWKPIEDRIYDIIDNVKPHYFIVDINPGDEVDHVYVQAMSGAGGWFIEAMSEAFGVRAQSDDVKRNFMRLNWTPPSASEPNYVMDLSEPPSPEVVRMFTDALEFGYGLKPSQVRQVKITSQGKDKY